MRYFPPYCARSRRTGAVPSSPPPVIFVIGFPRDCRSGVRRRDSFFRKIHSCRRERKLSPLLLLRNGGTFFGEPQWRERLSVSAYGTRRGIAPQGVFRRLFPLPFRLAAADDLDRSRSRLSHPFPCLCCHPPKSFFSSTPDCVADLNLTAVPRTHMQAVDKLRPLGTTSTFPRNCSLVDRSTRPRWRSQHPIFSASWWLECPLIFPPSGAWPHCQGDKLPFRHLISKRFSVCVLSGQSPFSQMAFYFRVGSWPWTLETPFSLRSASNVKEYFGCSPSHLIYSSLQQPSLPEAPRVFFDSLMFQLESSEDCEIFCLFSLPSRVFSMSPHGKNFLGLGSERTPASFGLLKRCFLTLSRSS